MNLFKDKVVTVYPTYGYRRGGGWAIPLRVWVHKPRRVDAVPDDLLRVVIDEEGALKEDEVVRCRECVAGFLADDDSGETVTLKFDAGGEELRFREDTDANGLVEETFELPGDRAAGWLDVAAEVKGPFGKVHAGRGRVRLLEPEGKSVVSDIDDTIKVSEIPAGRRIILRNTFLRDYVIAEGMLERYRGLGDVSFHYVSGSPWQLFGLLHAFLVEREGFPEGTFHMKSLRKNPLDLNGFLRDLKNFLEGKEYTRQMKIEQISELMDNLPGRTFTLIGDSGELDPEVFTHLRRERPRQVEKIIIRDVVGARAGAPERLLGVDEVIDAPLVSRGRSQFD